MNTSDRTVVNYLEGEGSELPPETRASLDALRTLLADEALWVEPSADLESTVVSAVLRQPEA